MYTNNNYNTEIIIHDDGDDGKNNHKPYEQDDGRDGKSTNLSQDSQKRVSRFKLPVSQCLAFPSPTASVHNTTTTTSSSGGSSGGQRRASAILCLAVDPSGSRFATGSADGRLRLYDFAGLDRARPTPFRTVIPEGGGGGGRGDDDGGGFGSSGDMGHRLSDVCYSNTGDRLFLATAGGVQPRVLDRDGHLWVECCRGDRYVSDVTKTTGHTAVVTATAWHPFEKHLVASASADGSVRMWDLERGRRQFQKLVCERAYPARDAKGRKTAVTALAFHPAGREFAMGTAAGDVQIWNVTRVSGRPERTVLLAHHPTSRRGNEKDAGIPVTALVYNIDGTRLASRSEQDDCVHVWNAKRLTSSSLPSITCTNVPCVHEASNMAFNLDGKVLCVVTSRYHHQDNHAQNLSQPGKPPRESGEVCFYNVSATAGSSSSTSVATMTSSTTTTIVADPILSLPHDHWQGIEKNASPVVVKWHVKMNQIFIGFSNGQVAVSYDPQFPNTTTTSRGSASGGSGSGGNNNSSKAKGAMLVRGSVSSAKSSSGEEQDLADLLRKRAESHAGVSASAIVAPFALPMYRNDLRDQNTVMAEREAKKRKRMERKDPMQSREPNGPQRENTKRGDRWEPR